MNFSPLFKRSLSLAFLIGILFHTDSPASAAEINVPLLRVGKTATLPQIDGQLTDDAWKSSITLSDFSITGSNRPASEPTQVKLAYDAGNLYVAWQCWESLLTVAQQRMHEVRSNARNRDGDVFNDDNVVLFLQPNGGDASYEFNINSLGTVFDAGSKRSDLWGARNALWNSNAVAAALQEDGFWTVELAIPWKAFGLNTAPPPGTTWDMELVRRAVGRGEVSAWNQHESSAIHLVSRWGQLIFDEAVPGISFQSLPVFEAGKSNLIVQVLNAPHDVTVEANVKENNNITRFQQTAKATSSPATLNIPVAAGSDTLLWQWLVKSQNGALLYRSPELLLSAQNTQARLKISTQASWKLFVNQEQISEGTSATNREIEIPLIQGVNDIQVETQSGTAQLELRSPVFSPQNPLNWSMAPATTGTAPATRTWSLARHQDNIFGIPGAPAILRHQLLWKATPYYPTTEPAFYIAQGTAQQLSFIVEGIEGIRFNDWHVMIAVPQEVEVLGSSGLYGKQIAVKPQFHMTPVREVTMDGRRLQLYRVTADKPLIYKKNQSPLLITCEVLLRLRQGQQHDPAKEWPLYYWTQGNQNTVTEAPQSIRIRTAPAVRGKQPKKLAWEFWTSGTHVYDDRELLRNILDTARQAGFNKYQASSWKDFNDMVREYCMQTFALVMFKDGRTYDVVRPYLVNHPGARMIDKTGKPQADYMCTTQLLGDSWPMFAKSIQEWMLKADLDAVEYDYEYPPFNPPHACFCNRCLTEFRSFAKLAPNLELSPESIQKNYTGQWIDFMAYRTAILLSKMKQAVHEANPKVKFTSYSGYYDAKNNTTKTRYGIDWDLVGQMQAIDEAGMGYGRPVPAITDSITALRGIPVKYGELLVPYDIRSQHPVAPLKKATLLRRALDSTGGVLIYERKAMDGRSWYALGEITRLVADYEDLFIAHRLETIPGQDPAKLQVLKGDTHVLVCVMNETSKPATYEFLLPARLGRGREYYSGKTVAAGEAIKLTLEPGEVTVYVLQAD